MSLNIFPLVKKSISLWILHISVTTLESPPLIPPDDTYYKNELKNKNKNKTFNFFQLVNSVTRLLARVTGWEFVIARISTDLNGSGFLNFPFNSLIIQMTKRQLPNFPYIHAYVYIIFFITNMKIKRIYNATTRTKLPLINNFRSNEKNYINSRHSKSIYAFIYYI